MAVMVQLAFTETEESTCLFILCPTCASFFFSRQVCACLACMAACREMRGVINHLGVESETEHGRGADCGRGGGASARRSGLRDGDAVRQLAGRRVFFFPSGQGTRRRGGDATKRRLREVQSKTEADDVTIRLRANQIAEKYPSGSLLYRRYRYVPSEEDRRRS
jgi:hypothetical protein